LVLSGGGLKFAVHAGIYERLEQIPYYEGELQPQAALPALSEAFDCVVGTSAGSLVASAIACGFCAEDISRFSKLFSQPAFQPFVLDPNWRGLGSFLLRGDLGYIKGIYRGNAIQRTLEVFFSHNYLLELGQLYSDFARRRENVDGPEFEKAITAIFKRLLELPPERLPEMQTAPNRLSPNATKPMLRPITFQDINPGARIPDETALRRGEDLPALEAEAEMSFARSSEHAALYREALTEYYRGREAAGRYVPYDPTRMRPMLFVIGTDLVTGQKTVFCNYNWFEKYLVYGPGAKPPPILYRYIDPKGRMSGLPSQLEEELRPANFLYRYLSSGLPVAWAVRASISIPGVFAPVAFDYLDQYGVARTDFFIDGGVTDNYALQVAAGNMIGRCGRILGGNIGNMGPRVHDYGVKNVVQILMRTVLMMGDANVDANADNELTQQAAVTTINELTKNDVSSISELAKIPALLEEGRQLADQFFGAFPNKGRPFLLDRLFGGAGSFIVFLPRIETYGLPPGSAAPPPQPVPDSCAMLPSGASEIDRIVESDSLSAEEKKARSEVLGECETRLTPPPVLEPGGLLSGGVSPKPGQEVSTSAPTDLFNLARRGVLLIVLSFTSLLGLGVWRVGQWVWERLNLFTAVTDQFDSWNFWPVLGTVLVGALWLYLLFFRAVIFDTWVAHPTRLPRRALEIPVGLALYVLSLWLLQLLEVLAEPFRTLAGLLLISFSSGALLFTLYALVFSFLTWQRRSGKK
jgi:predicted acylesterase/phospholipase RssA